MLFQPSTNGVEPHTSVPRLPYCMVLAVATMDSVLLYETEVRKGSVANLILQAWYGDWVVKEQCGKCGGLWHPHCTGRWRCERKCGCGVKDGAELPCNHPTHLPTHPLSPPLNTFSLIALLGSCSFHPSQTWPAFPRPCHAYILC